MLEIFNKWYRRYLFEEESVLLLVILYQQAQETQEIIKLGIEVMQIYNPIY